MSGLLFYFPAVTRLDSALSQNPCVGVFNCCQVFRQLQNLTAATIPLQAKKKNPGLWPG